MHYIFPAAAVALELQNRSQAYLDRPPNPLFEEVAKHLRFLHRHRHEQRVLRYYVDCAERLKAELERALRRLLSGQGRIEEGKLRQLEQLYDEACGVIFSAQNLVQTNTTTEEAFDQWMITQGKKLEKGFKVLGLTRLFQQPSASPEDFFLSLEQCRRLVRALLEDELNAQMQWVSINPDTRSHVQQALQELIPLWDALDENLHPRLPPEHLEAWKDQVVRYCGDFYREVIEPIQKVVSAWVHENVPYRTWEVWTVRELGWDIALEKGEDFRVLDWKRRMASGEWKHDARSVRLTVEVDPVELDRVVERDIEATMRRLEQETRLGFSPLFFRPRLTELLLTTFASTPDPSPEPR